MKTLRRVLIGVPVFYVSIMLITGLAAKFILSGTLRDTLLSKLEDRLPVSVSLEGADFDLLQWFFLTPAVSLQDLTVGNLEGFPSKNLLEVESVSTVVGLAALLEKRVDVHSFRLKEPRFYLDNDRQGVTNVERLLEALSAGGPSEEQPQEPTSDGPDIQEFEVDELILESGAVVFTDVKPDGKQTTVTLDPVDIRLTDFALSRSSEIQFAAELFGGRNSRVDFNGRAGPFRPDSVGASGELAVEIAPAEIPSELREEYAGDLLKEPGDDSRIRLDTAMEGDLVGVFQGEGELQLSDVQVGADPESSLPLNGRTPIALEVQGLLTRPVMDLTLPDATLSLGRGEWKGKADLGYDGTRLHGETSGGIQGVRINEMLSAFTSVRDLVFGALTVEQYNLRFSGEDAAQMRDSLAGAGNIRIDEGHITLFDLFNTIEQNVSQVLSGGATSGGETTFATFTSPVEIKNRRVHLTDAILKSSTSLVRGKGYASFDQDLHFDLTAAYTGQLAAMLGGKSGRNGQAEIQVPARLRGTMESPQVEADLGQVAIDQVSGFLDSFFGGKKKEP
jgi:uncharacterized protein involved in outer membrane biogenesis